MPSPIVWSVAGASALGFGQRAAEAVASGLSFAAELAGLEDNASVAESGGSSQQQPRESFGPTITRLAQRIAEKLQQAGMLLTQPVSLVSDGLAGIAVGGDHPQADSIEQILRADMTLERDFDRLARDYQSQCGDELMINVELK